MPQVSCHQCGKQRYKTPSDIKKTKRSFCSRKCWALWMAANNKGISRPGVSGPNLKLRKRVKLKCPTCNKVFEVKKSHAKRRTYCSKRCVDSPGQIKTKCQFCGDWFLAKKSEYLAGKGKFCSKKCTYAYQRTLTGPLTNNWKGGYDSYYGPNWKSQRRKARKRDNYTCQHCGISEERHGKQLDVHHIIPFRVFGVEKYKEANKLSNLISLCMTCHRRIERLEGDKY